MDATKRLEGVIDIRLTDRAEQALGRLKQQFEQMEQGVARARGGGKVSRKDDAPGKAMEDAARSTDKATTSARDYAAQIERIRQVTLEVNRGLRDQWTMQHNFGRVLDNLRRAHVAIVEEIEKGEDADRQRIALLKARATLQDSILRREQTVVREMHRQEVVAAKDRERLTKQAAAEDLKMNFLHARVAQENARRDAAAAKARQNMDFLHAKALKEYQRHKQTQIQDEMRHNAMRNQALQMDRERTAELRRQSGILGVMGRRMQAVGGLRGGASGTALRGGGAMMQIVGEMGVGLGQVLKVASAVGTGLLRAYWIALSFFYAVRNVLELIGDGYRLVYRVSQRIVGVFAALGKSVVAAASRIEKLRSRLQVMFGEKEGKGVLDWVMEEAIGKPFEWTALAEGVVRAMVMGAKDQRVMRAILEVAEDMAVAFEQPVDTAVHAIMQGAAGHFRSLIETFGFRPEMAVAYGAAKAPQGQGIAGGPQNFNTNLQAIMRMVSDRVGGAADAMKNTWEGLVSDLQDMWGRVVNDLFDPVLQPLKAVVSGLRELFLEGGSMAPWASSLVGTMEKAWGMVEDIAKWLVPRLDDIIAVVVAFFAYVVDGMVKWYNAQGGIKGIMETIRDWFFDWGPALLDAASSVVQILGFIHGIVVRIGGYLLKRAGAAAAKGELRAAGIGLSTTGREQLTYEQWQRINVGRRPEAFVKWSQAMVMGEQTPEAYERSAHQLGIEDDPAVAATLQRWRDARAMYRAAIESNKDLVAEVNRKHKKLVDDIVAALSGAAGKIREGSGRFDVTRRGKHQQGPVDILSALFEGFGPLYAQVRQQMGRELTHSEVVKTLGVAIKNAHAQGAATTEEAITSGFDAGTKKIENMFDVGKFMGYTAMAARHGYGTQQAMDLAQSRVLQEMAVRSGERGATVSPWPWANRAAAQQTTWYGGRSGPYAMASLPDGSLFPTGVVMPTRGRNRPEPGPMFNWGRGGVGGNLNVSIRVDAEEGIRAVVQEVRLEEQQAAVGAWHRG